MLKIKTDEGVMTVHFLGDEGELTEDVSLLMLVAVKIMKELEYDKRHCRDKFETAINRYY